LAEPTRRAVLAAAAPWLLAAAAPGPAEVAYGPAPRQRLDVYPQAGLAAAPMLLFVHGGAWGTGDKRDVYALPDYARRHGVLLASAGYRLGIGAEGAAQDVAAAAAWLLAGGARWGGDPARLFVAGHSAGGHLAALAAIDPRYLSAHGRTGADLAGVIGLDGAGYDAARELPGMARVMPASELALWRRAFGDRAAALSPTRLVRPERAYPPFLLVYTDHPGGRLGCVGLAGALRAAGGRAAVVEAPDRTHDGLLVRFGLAGDPYGELAARFIASGALP
jgi:acetyl esterase/lipase